MVVDVAAGEPLPTATRFAGIIVTGSHAMVTDRADWSERTAAWLARAVRASIPTLGICFGHQLLAYALGGRVTDNPTGLEVGTVVVTPNAFGEHDLLLGGFRVRSRPTCAIGSPSSSFRRGRSRWRPPQEACAAFSVNRCAWGVQFHPEFDGRIAKAYALREVCELTARGRGCGADPGVLHGYGERAGDFSAFSGGGFRPP
jgi:GMP synthase (glutamine-hydrolysing)